MMKKNVEELKKLKEQQDKIRKQQIEMFGISNRIKNKMSEYKK